VKQVDFLTKPGTADTLWRILRPAAILYLVLALWLGGRVFLLNRECADAAASAKKDFAATGSLKRQLADATKPESKKSSRNNGVAAALQSFIEARSEAQGCSVSEFQASSETQPYLSLFLKDTPPGPWLQAEVIFSIKGRLPDVFRAVTSLSEQVVPFEPSSVELARDGVATDGATTVVARVQGRVLSRGGEAKL
jgi:hypothetical protein